MPQTKKTASNQVKPAKEYHILITHYSGSTDKTVITINGNIRTENIENMDTDLKNAINEVLKNHNL